MGVHVSAGVYTREIDISLYIPQLSTTIFGIVGTAPKGPIDKKTFISTWTQYVETFGGLDPDHLMSYAAYNYLMDGDQLWVVRVTEHDNLNEFTATSASVTVSAAGGGDAITFDCIYQGTWGNTIKLVLRSGTPYYDETGTIVEAASGALGGESFELLVYEGNTLVERWDQLNMSASAKDINGNSRYIEDVIGTAVFGEEDFEIRKSNYVAVTVEDNNAKPYLGTNVAAGQTYYFDPSYFNITPTLAYSYTPGTDEIDDLEDADVIGIYNMATNTRTGLEIFTNAEDIDVNLIAAPGFSSDAIISKLITICEDRADCMALIDPPLGLSVQEVVDWHNGDLLAGIVDDNTPGDSVGYLRVSLNSSYGALYYPWVKVYDPYNSQRVWLPPSAVIGGVYARNDRETEVWFAPAGFNRARLTQVLDLEVNLSQGDRDYMYGNQNAINPIVNFKKDGVVVWGQRTLQRAPTALDRVNVRRLLLYLRKVIATAAKSLVFEPNDDRLWSRFRLLVEPYLRNVQNRRGLFAHPSLGGDGFLVKCDETTTTIDLYEQNIMKAMIFLKPTKAAEIIQIDFVITPQAMTFSEAFIVAQI